MEQAGTTQKTIYSVREITRLVKGVLEGAFEPLWIEGEVSNLRRPGSGHMYFTLKDEHAQIRAVFFRGSQRGMKFVPQNGMMARVYGELTVYEPAGDYQLLVRRMEEGGQGALHARFEALKKALQQEGLFDAQRKRPLPVLPRCIGVVTSATGAAFQDILNVIHRRYPDIRIIIAPARVQGNGAAAEIAEAIRRLNDHGAAEVMIVGRGGGSLEDLWCFNEEEVARSIAASKIPVISAVGHEIDFTIADFAADQRAPTPSAAAELVIGPKLIFEQQVEQLSQRLLRSIRESLRRIRSRLDLAAGSYVFREPHNLVQLYRQRIDSVRIAMGRNLQHRVMLTRQHVDDAALRMGYLCEARIDRSRQRLENVAAALRTLNPLAVLGRGYSITLRTDGQAVRSVGEVNPGDSIITRVEDGTFTSNVSNNRKEELL